MLNSDTKRHIDAARDVLVGVAPNPTTQIDQITYALIYKFMDDMDQSAIKAGGEPSFFIGDLEPFAWSRLMNSRMGNQEKMNMYGEALTKFSEAKQLPELFRTIFRAAFLPYRSPETLGLFLKEISYFDYSHPEELGNAYEYLLSIMSAQGDAGQFRTPRHIIDFIVDVINPTKDDKVLDPSCGTAGFLVSTYNHILEQHDGKDDPKKKEKLLTPDERKKLMQNLQGYDIDPTMVRIAQVNMYLHQFKNPQIFQYDSLTSEERWNDKFDVILANPPFMSPKGGIKPHNKFSAPSNRAEVLFVDYIINHLRPKGRAGIIVPEGIIFQSGNAYKALRKNLIENGLYAVVSLPGGVFNPYSGVKTSILLIDNELSKQKSEIAFIKISADGYDLGATKREVSQNDLPLALESLKAWASGKNIENTIFTLVSKEEIAEKGDYNLSGDRYKKGTNSINSEFGRVALKDVITLNFGDRITKKNEAGDKYPVYGGGGESFRTDNFNRQDELIIARFAMGPNCVRYVSGQFWLMDSGGSYSLTENYEGKFRKKFVDHVLINIQDEVYQCARGGAQKNLHLEKFYELEIPMPPLDIQEQLVTELDGYAAIISGAKQIVENWKPQIDLDPNWKMVEISEVCNVIGGGTPDRKAGEYWGAGIPWLSARYIGDDHTVTGFEEITKLGLENSSSKIAPKNSTILITRVSVGKYAFADRDYAINQDLTALVSKNTELNEQFLSIAIGEVAKNVARDAVGVGVTGVTRDYINKCKIPLPQISTQIEIVNRIEIEKSHIESAKKLIETYEARTQAVIAKLWSE